MKHMLAASCLFITMSACEQSPVLESDSFGPIRFGEQLTQVEKLLGQKAMEDSSPSGSDSCWYIRFEDFPGSRFMIEDGIVTRMDAAPSVKNSADITVGEALSTVTRRLPNIVVEPHKYDDTGHYLILKSPDSRSAIVAEEGQGKVTEVRAGVIPSVQYVEGCL